MRAVGLGLVAMLAACSKPAAHREAHVAATAPPPRVVHADAGAPAATDASDARARHRLTPAEGTLAIHPIAHAVPGHAAVATVSVFPAHGYEINTSLKPRLELAPPVGIERAKTAVTTFDPRRIAVDVTVTAREAGAYALNGKLRFVVCKRDRCFAKDQPISIPIRVVASR